MRRGVTEIRILDIDVVARRKELRERYWTVMELWTLVKVGDDGTVRADLRVGEASMSVSAEERGRGVGGSVDHFIPSCTFW